MHEEANVVQFNFLVISYFCFPADLLS